MPQQQWSPVQICDVFNGDWIRKMALIEVCSYFCLDTFGDDTVKGFSGRSTLSKWREIPFIFACMYWWCCLFFKHMKVFRTRGWTTFHYLRCSTERCTCNSFFGLLFWWNSLGLFNHWNASVAHHILSGFVSVPPLFQLNPARPFLFIYMRRPYRIVLPH